MEGGWKKLHDELNVMYPVHIFISLIVIKEKEMSCHVAHMMVSECKVCVGKLKGRIQM